MATLERVRTRYRTDAVFRAKKLKSNRIWREVNSEALKAVNRDRMRWLRLDPAFRAKEKEYKRTHPEVSRRAVKKYATRKYREDPEFRAKQIGYAQKSYKKLRQILFAGYGNVCACCGEKESVFLELDHVNGGGSKHFASHKSPLNLYREVIAANFPPIYRLLCANCNRGRQRNAGICPHQAGR